MVLAFVEARVDPNNVDALRLFADVDLTVTEREILDRLIDSTNVVRTGRFSDLIRKANRIGSLLPELRSRGITLPQVLDSVDIPTSECERIALEYFQRLRPRLGRKCSALMGVGRHLDRLLPASAYARMIIGDQIRHEVRKRRGAHTMIGKVLARGAAVLHQTKNPLVQVPPARLARVLIDQGLTNADACALTARFLTTWDPKRFRGLTADHVRRRVQRKAIMRS
jgi:hypothetical protein